MLVREVNKYSQLRQIGKKLLKILRITVAILIIGIVVYYLYDNANKVAINLSLQVLSLIIFLFIISNVIRGIRFYLLCLYSNMINISLLLAIKVVFSSNLLNAVLPGRIGELIKFIAVPEKKSKLLQVILLEKGTELLLLIYSFVFLLFLVKWIDLPFEFFISATIIGWASIFLLNHSLSNYQVKYIGTTYSNRQLMIATVSAIPYVLLDSITLFVIFNELSIIGNLTGAALSIIAGSLMFVFPVTPGSFGQFEFSIAIVVEQLTKQFTNALYAAVIYRLLNTFTFALIGLIPSINYLLINKRNYKNFEKSYT
jgi:uncharacterized membrane protein YbhN (UPF0104 family)